VRFGGNSAPNLVAADLWSWNGTTWSVVGTPVPPPRNGAPLAYDAARQRVVRFGGEDTILAPTNETWEWDGFRWTQRTPALAPGARSRAALAYDSTRQRVVLFGGLIPSTSLVSDETWEWDGVSWLQRSPATRPPA